MSLFTDLQLAGLPVVSATDMLGKPKQATFSRTLTEEEIEIYHNLLFPFRQIQKEREADALNQASLAGQFKTAAPQQAVDYVQQQITNGVTEVQALAAFDSAYGNATALAILTALRPILRNMLISIYRITDVLKLVARILVAIRNKVMPTLPEQ